MAQAQLNAIKLDKLDTPTYNPKFTPPQSQDAFGLEMGHYDHRPNSYMDREDFAILTTTMDGIVTAMNIMSDQISNHTDMVVKELKEQKEKSKEFMDKVDSKLGQMKTELQKILNENDDKKEEMTKQTETIVKEQRQIYGLLADKFKEQRQKN